MQGYFCMFSKEVEACVLQHLLCVVFKEDPHYWWVTAFVSLGCTFSSLPHGRVVTLVFVVDRWLGSRRRQWMQPVCSSSSVPNRQPLLLIPSISETTVSLLWLFGVESVGWTILGMLSCLGSMSLLALRESVTLVLKLLEIFHTHILPLGCSNPTTHYSVAVNTCVCSQASGKM